MAFKTKQSLSNKKFSQISSDALNLSGTTTFNGSFIFEAGSEVTVLPTQFNDETTGIMRQPDGKIIVLGQFTTFNGDSHVRIVRLNPDFSVDNSFITGSGFPSTTGRATLQPDGKIIIIGGFVSYNGDTAIGIVRLNQDGTIDNTFNSGSGISGGGGAFKAALQSTGKIIVSGDFNSYDGNPVNGIVRLNDDGSYDSTFTDYPISSALFDIVVLDDDSILVSDIGNGFIVKLEADGDVDGTFTPFAAKAFTFAVQPDGKIVTQTGRANPDGTPDGTFNVGSGFDGFVQSIKVLPDGKLLCVGAFDTIDGDNSPYVYCAARLNSDGTVDSTFNHSYLFNVSAGQVSDTILLDETHYLLSGDITDGFSNQIILIYDSVGNTANTYTSTSGEMLIKGKPIQYDGDYSLQYDDRSIVDRGYVEERLAAIAGFNGLHRNGDEIGLGGMITGTTRIKVNDGSISKYFQTPSGASDPVFTSKLQIDGQLLVGGVFSTYNNEPAAGLIRLNPDGSTDYTFARGTGFATINTIDIDSGTTNIVIGGSFTTYSGASANYIVKLLSDGTIDPTFNSGTGFDNAVNAVLIDSVGKIYVGGSFTTYSGASANYLIRLNSDGSIDETFQTGTGFDQDVFALAFQSDGKLLVGGQFLSYSGVTDYLKIIRLNTDGSIDTTFTGTTDVVGNTLTIKVLPDDKILLGGSFESYDGAEGCIVKLNSNGGKDFTFNAGTGFDFPSAPNVREIYIQPDNKIIVGGNFDSYNGIPVSFIVRLLPNGDYDRSFRPDGGGVDSIVLTIARVSPTKLYVGGFLSSYNGEPTNYAVLLNLDTDLLVIENGGLRYGDELTTSFQETSLVDKKYVDNIVALSGGSAANGLSKVGSNIVLGGALTGNTLVDTSDYDLQIQKGSAEIHLAEFPYFVVGSGLGGSSAYAITQLSGGSLIFGGDFSEYKGNSIGYGILKTDESGTEDATFLANAGTGFDSDILSLAVDLNQLIHVGGYFSDYNGNSAQGYVVLNPDGTINSAFMANVGTATNGGYIDSIKVQTDGKIVIGGWFEEWNGNTSPEYQHLVRLNPDGTVDTTFQTNLGAGIDNEVTNVLVQSDGKILIVGYFITVDGVSLNRIARLNDDGTPDTTFNTNIGTGSDDSFDYYNSGIVEQSTGQLVIVTTGSFFNDNPVVNIFRLNNDGTFDNTFNVPSLTGTGLRNQFDSLVQINRITLSPDDDGIIVGANSVVLNGAGAHYLFKLSADASSVLVDYGVDLDSDVYGLHVDPLGRVYGGGYFTVNNIGVGIVRYTATGLLNIGATPTKDTLFVKGNVTYDQDYSSGYTSFSVVHKGYVDQSILDIKVQNGIRRTGTNPDITYELGGDVYSTELSILNQLSIRSNTAQFIMQPDIFSQEGINNSGKVIKYHAGLDKFVIGGFFTTYAGNPAKGVVMVGTGEEIFDAYGLGVYYAPFNQNVELSVNGGVNDLVIQPDGKIIIVGQFTTVNGVSSRNIARLNTDGTYDTSFNVGAGFQTAISDGFEGYATSVGLLSDGRVAVTGLFKRYNGVTIGRNIALLNTTGGTDATFTTNSGSGFTAVAFVPQWRLIVQPDDKILVCGQNTQYNGAFAAKLFRLLPTGIHDPAFTPALGFDTRAMALQPDGKILFSQQFGGLVGRLTSSGTSDATFVTGAGVGGGGRTINTILVQSDGKILYGGNNTETYDGVPIKYIFRVNNNGSLDTTYPYDSQDIAFTTVAGGFGANGFLEFGDFVYMVNVNTLNGVFTRFFTRTDTITGLPETGFVKFRNTMVEYGLDYSPLYNDRTLVDKGYVDGVVISASSGSSKTVFGITGNNVTTNFVVTHNKATRDVSVQVYENFSPWGTIIVDTERTTVNTVTVKFNTAPGTGIVYRVVII